MQIIYRLDDLSFKAEHKDDEDEALTMKMSMYMLAALKYFDKLPLSEVKGIAYQIAMLGTRGIDVNKSGYKVASIDKEFGGYELLAYYYISWTIACPKKLEMLKLPFSKAYALARQMFESGS